MDSIIEKGVFEIEHERKPVLQDVLNIVCEKQVDLVCYLIN